MFNCALVSYAVTKKNHIECTFSPSGSNKFFTETFPPNKVTVEQLHAWKDGVLIQHAFPNLTDDERELFINGLTSDAFDDLFSEEE